MTAPVRFKQDDVKRAVAGAAAAGMRVDRVEILTDGRIVVLSNDPARPAQDRNPWDDELK